MKISTRDKKVRATELPLVTRGIKATVVALRRWYSEVRSSHYDTGKTGVPGIANDRSANRENEINQARVDGTNKRKRTICDENELRNVANENLENELRELTMSGIGMTDSDHRA